MTRLVFVIYLSDFTTNFFKNDSTRYRETPIPCRNYNCPLYRHTLFNLPFLRLAKQLSSHERLISNRFEPDCYSSRCNGTTNLQRAGRNRRISRNREFIGPIISRCRHERAFDYRPTLTLFRVTYNVWRIYSMYVERGINYRDFMALETNGSLEFSFIEFRVNS